MNTDLIDSPSLRPRFRQLHDELRALGFTGRRVEHILFEHVMPRLAPEQVDPYWARRTPVMFAPRYPVPDMDEIPPPLRLLLRLFHENQAVERDALGAVLSAPAIRTLMDSGMLSEDGAALVPSVSLTEWQDLLIASDRHDRITEPDAVFRPHLSTSAPTWFLPRDHAVARAVDVGTGSGILSLLLRRRYGAEVYTVDPNPRAVRICELNLALNDMDGVNVAVGDHASLARDGRLAGATDLLIWNMPNNFWEHRARCWGFPTRTEGERVLAEIYGALPALLSPRGTAVLRHESRLPLAWFEDMVAATPGADALQVLFVHEGEAHGERGQIYELLKDSWDECVPRFDPSWAHGIAVIRRRVEPRAAQVSLLPFDTYDELMDFRADAWEPRWSSRPGWQDYRLQSE